MNKKSVKKPLNKKSLPLAKHYEQNKFFHLDSLICAYFTKFNYSLLHSVLIVYRLQIFVLFILKIKKFINKNALLKHYSVYISGLRGQSQANFGVKIAGVAKNMPTQTPAFF